MIETIFRIPKMDCSSEERMIRLALEGISAVKKLDFDLAHRHLKILHGNDCDEILSKLVALKLGAEVLASREFSEVEELQLESPAHTDAEESRVLRLVFFLNAGMFLVELAAGWIAESTGLLADSLDMFADAAVFALSLYAVGKTLSLKRRAARISGYLQMALALGAFFEVARRFIHGSDPEGPAMMIVAGVALVVNAACMWILAKHRNGEAHMQASWIFLTNDVIANAAVILAGFLVMLTRSQIPDLVTGALIGGIVFAGSLKILRAAA